MHAIRPVDDWQKTTAVAGERRSKPLQHLDHKLEPRVRIVSWRIHTLARLSNDAIDGAISQVIGRARSMQ